MGFGYDMTIKQINEGSPLARGRFNGITISIPLRSSLRATASAQRFQNHLILLKRFSKKMFIHHKTSALWRDDEDTGNTNHPHPHGPSAGMKRSVEFLSKRALEI